MARIATGPFPAISCACLLLAVPAPFRRPLFLAGILKAPPRTTHAPSRQISFPGVNSPVPISAADSSMWGRALGQAPSSLGEELASPRTPPLFRPAARGSFYSCAYATSSAPRSNPCPFRGAPVAFPLHRPPCAPSFIQSLLPRITCCLLPRDGPWGYQPEDKTLALL